MSESSSKEEGKACAHYSDGRSSPVPVRSKVYTGFNFTFPQPIRARLWLLGEL